MAINTKKKTKENKRRHKFQASIGENRKNQEREFVTDKAAAASWQFGRLVKRRGAEKDDRKECDK